MMRTDLSHLPGAKQRELERVLAIIHEEFAQMQASVTQPKSRARRILKVILYGSYARTHPSTHSRRAAASTDTEVLPRAKSAWVEDAKSGYASDYDILVVVNQKELTPEGNAGADLWHKVEDRLTQAWLAKRIKPPVNIIVHTLSEVNDALAAGKYFFTDIYRDGVALYELPGHKLRRPGRLPPDVAYKEAQEHFEEWFENAARFYVNYQDNIARSWFKQAAFLLHQCVESLYHCTLLVLTNYAPHTHNIQKLRSMCEERDLRLVDAWPRTTRAQRRPFNRLKEAYVKARYSRHYKITQEELEDLNRCVTRLQALVKTVCEEHLAALKTQAGANL